MKRNLLILIFVSLLSEAIGQNGTTVIPMPTFFNPFVLRYKNCLASDQNGVIWLGTRDNGILTWDGANWNYFDVNSGLSDYHVRCLDYDPNSGMWAGTDTGGVCLYNGSSWAVYARWNSPLPGKRVYCMLQQGNKRWFGTDRGLASFDGTNWNVYTRQNSGLICDTVTTLAASQTGELLVGTAHNMIRFNGSSWYGQQTVFGNAMIDVLYVHSDGTEWASCGGALYRNNAGSFTSFAALYDVPWTGFPQGVKSIGRGPTGGVSFCTGRGTLNEVVNDRLRTYYPYGEAVNNSYAATTFHYCAATNTFWFVNTYTPTLTAPMNALLKFDPAQYNGLGAGLTGDNSKNLDANNISARIFDRGDMHWDLVASDYHVPANGSTTTVFCSGLWIGGLDSSGVLHQAAMTYRQRGEDYFPGPIDAQTQQTDSSIAWKFDRLWKVDRYHISEFQWQFANGNVQNGSYAVPMDILEWPAIGNYGITSPLAPFVDVNGNGIYDPLAGGDYPVIRGDQELFGVFNDQLATHGETGAPALGIEVHFHAYAYACPQADDSIRAINYTTFYSYEIINRSSVSYQQVRLGFFNDVDLGMWDDDYGGCYPPDNVGFCYNGDAVDGPSSAPCYGNYPPIQSTVVLDGPPAVPGDNADNDNDGVIDEPGEKALLNSFLSYAYSNPFPYGSPQDAGDYYSYISSRWADSSQVTYGMDGHTSAVPSQWMYPALPDDTAGWSEMTAQHPPFDRNMIIGSGPVNMSPGDTLHYALALVTTFDSVNAWNSHAYYQSMISDVHHIQQWYTTNNFPSCTPLFDAVEEHSSSPLQLSLYPNPATDELHMRYASTGKSVTVEIYDVNGKRMFAGMWLSETMTVPLAAYAPGLYFVRIADGNRIIAGKFLKN